MLFKALRKPSASGLARLKCRQPKESLRLLGVQNTCCFSTIDVRNDENERFREVKNSI